MTGFTAIASTIPVYAANSSGDSKATIAVDNAVAAPAADATFATDQVAADLAATSSTVGSKVVSFVQAKGTSYTFDVYADPDLGKVVVETDAPARDVAALLGKDAGQVVVRKGKVTDLFSRRDDAPAFRGGAGIRSGGAICSSGYTVANSANTLYQVTTGHCAPNGATEVTELGNRTFGVVRGNGLPSKDMELLGGQSYGSFIYGGGVSSTGYHVAGAGNPVVGFTNYCHSGRTTGENHGHTVQSVTGPPSAPAAAASRPWPPSPAASSHRAATPARRSTPTPPAAPTSTSAGTSSRVTEPPRTPSCGTTSWHATAYIS